MIKKFMILIIVYLNIYAMYPVTDITSYQYLISGIKQYTQMINGITQQIQSLGGIRSSVEDLKDALNSSKSELTGSLASLEKARNNLKDTVDNTEIKSLFDMNAARKSASGTGIAYDDIAKVFSNSFKKADDGLIKMIGGKEKAKEFLSTQYKMNQGLDTTNVDDFITIMNNKDLVDPIKIKENILIKDYVDETHKMDRDAKQAVAAELISEDWKATFFPSTDEELEAIEKRTERLKELSEFIENAKDVKQSIKTTNMILMEMLQLLQKDFNSALHYRNAMASLFLKNGEGSKLALELEKRYEEIDNTSKGLPKSLKKSKLSIMEGSNPYGIGWRPLK